MKWFDIYNTLDCSVTRIRTVMSIILGKYKNKRRLGKGAYGDVLLVEDPEGKEFALKIISKKVLERDPFMEEYL